MIRGGISFRSTDYPARLRARVTTPYTRHTSTECKTLKGERRMIFIFNIITALNYNQDRVIFCPCGKDALSLSVLIVK